MHLPWHNKSGIPKAIAIVATIGILAFGLCTANFVIAPDSDGKWLQYVIPVCAITFVASMFAVAILVDMSKRRAKRKPNDRT